MTKSEKNAKKYIFGKNCEGFYFLESPGFNVKFERIPPGSSTSFHCHKGMTQFFFVKSGVLSIETDGKTHVICPGEGLELESHHKHRVFNSHNDIVEYLVAEKYFEDCSTYYD
jgi:uncharacterized cupin superfamily protein